MIKSAYNEDSSLPYGMNNVLYRYPSSSYDFRYRNRYDAEKPLQTDFINPLSKKNYDNCYQWHIELRCNYTSSGIEFSKKGDDILDQGSSLDISPRE